MSPDCGDSEVKGVKRRPWQWTVMADEWEARWEATMAVGGEGNGGPRTPEDRRAVLEAKR